MSRGDVHGIEDLSHDATELALYIKNERDVFFAYYVPAGVKLQKLWLADKFSLDLGIKRMRYAVDAAAKSHHLRHGSMWQAWSDKFSRSDRDAVAEYLCRCLVAEWRLGNMLGAS